MKKIILPFLLLTMSILVFSSCSSRLIDFTVISSKNTSFKIDRSQGVNVSGSSNGFLGLGASIKDALDKALQKAGPEYDLLLDGVVRQNDFILVAGYKVQGVAVSSAKLKAALGQKGFDEWCSANHVFNPDEAVVIK
jgi:hypothetical protein